jgi:hypothetical protein
MDPCAGSGVAAQEALAEFEAKPEDACRKGPWSRGSRRRSGPTRIRENPGGTGREDQSQGRRCDRANRERYARPQRHDPDRGLGQRRALGESRRRFSAYQLPEPFHKDTADRLIVAMARLLNAPVVF